LAVELDAKLGVLVVTLHVMFRQSAFGTFIVTVWLVAVNDELLTYNPINEYKNLINYLSSDWILGPLLMLENSK
jgi:hypothetical protein